MLQSGRKGQGNSMAEGWAAADDVYEWIESWDYVYEGGEWLLNDSE